MCGKIGLAETDQRTYKGVTLFGGVQFYDLFGDANVFVIVGPILMLLDVDPDFIFHACTSRFRFVGLDPFNLMQSGQSHMPKKNTLESDGWMQLLSGCPKAWSSGLLTLIWADMVLPHIVHEP
jgi:hypothetical protein